MKKVVLFFFVVVNFHVFSNEFLRGFTITGYSEDAYSNSIDIIDSIIDRYKNSHIYENLLVTFYVKPDGSIVADGRTPNSESIKEIEKRITSSGNKIGIFFYLDPYMNRSHENRWALKNINFNQWYDKIQNYVSNDTDLICLSPEMMAAENLSGWKNFIKKIKTKYPNISIGYNVHPSSSILATGQLKPWMKTLDYFGSTLIVNAPSGTVEEIQYGITAALQRVENICETYNLKPLYQEYGFPSHSRAVEQGSDFRASGIKDEKLQYFLFDNTLSLLNKYSFFFWRINPFDTEDSSATDYTWLNYSSSSQKLIPKTSTVLVEESLGLEKDLSVYPYNYLDKNLFNEKKESITLNKPVGVINTAADSNSGQSLGIEYYYEKLNRVFHLVPLKDKVSIILEGFSWSTAIRKYEEGKIVIKATQNGKYLDQYISPFAFQKMDYSTISIDVKKGLAMEIEVTLLPSDYACVLTKFIVKF